MAIKFMIVRDLGLIGFHEAYSIQERMAKDIASGRREETLLLLEHHPVYTIGSGGCEDNILDPAIDAVRTNRGGDITYHGPGQLVGYPIIDLSRRGRDLHRYLRFLEELLLDITAGYGIDSRRIAGRTGVWCDSSEGPVKLASIGVGVRRWVTMHGFALNVQLDLTPFARIRPCGIENCKVTSLSLEIKKDVGIDSVKERIRSRIQTILDARLPLADSDIII